MTWAELQAQFPGYTTALLALGGEGSGSGGEGPPVWTELEARRGALLKARLLAEVGPELPSVGEREGKGKDVVAAPGGWRRVAAATAADGKDEEEEEEERGGSYGGDAGSPPPLPPRGKGFVIAISKGG